jgi:bla regulator protein blaR1
MLCILYVIVLSTALGIAANLLERDLPARWPRRWIWCAVIALSVTIPAIYRTRHAATIGEVHAAHGAHGEVHRDAMGLSGALHGEWLAHVESYDGVINRIWLLASGTMIFLGLVSAVRVLLVLRSGRRRGQAVVDGIPVVVTESLGPATVGLLRCRVVVPRWVLALPGSERQYVLRHEDEHRRSHDALLLFVASLSLILIPWNLALWWLIRRLHLAIEMDCDRRVVSALGDATAYGTLLLRVAEAASRGPRLQPALLGRVGMLERRLTLLVSSVPRNRMMRVLAPLAACAVLLAALSMPHPVLAPESKAPSAAASVARR